MRIRQTIAAKIVMTMVVIGSATVVAQSPAAAHEAGNNSCPSGALCLWYDAHHEGGRYVFYGTNSSIHAWAIADDDSASRNNGTSGLLARVWEHTGYGGENTVCLMQGESKAHHFGDGDQASSNDWRSFCG